MTLSATTLPCPGCGNQVPIPPDARALTCTSCGEPLGVAPDRRLYLLHPIGRYRDLAEESEEPEVYTESNIAVKPPSLNEYRRKQVSLERALERNALEHEDASRSRKIGLGLVLFGALFVLVTIARSLLGDSTWVDLIAPGLISIGLTAAGISLIASGTLLVRTTCREAEELQRELEFIKGQVADDS